MTEYFSFNNPFYLSDTYICKEFECDTCFYGHVKLCVFVYVNFKKRIDEVGVSISNRLHSNLYAIKKISRPATEEEKNIIDVFTDDFWLMKIKNKDELL